MSTRDADGEVMRDSVLKALADVGWTTTACAHEGRYDCANNDDFFVALRAKERPEPHVEPRVTLNYS